MDTPDKPQRATTTTTITTTVVPVQLASLNQRGDKRGDTGDCTAQRTRSEPGPSELVAPSDYCRNRQSDNNKASRIKSNTNATAAAAVTSATTQGFYSISENLGFKRDRDNILPSDCDRDNNNIIPSSVSENGEHYINHKIDSQRDLNKCDPACLADYYENINALNDDGDDNDGESDTGEDGVGNFVIKSRVQAVDPRPSPNQVDNNLNTRIHDSSSTPPSDRFYSPSQKTRSSSHHSAFSSSTQHNHHQPAPVSSFNLILNLPERAETITQGFGVKMVATASCQQLMYRSVPPRPLSYTLTDVLEPKGPNQRSKTAPVSVNSPDDYAQRFKSRPTTRPRVIEFDGSTVSSKTKRMAMVSSGFPTSRAKIYIGHTKAMSPTPQNHSQTARSSGSKLHLAPLEHPGRRSTSGFTPGSSRTTRTIDRVHGKGGGSIHGNHNAAARETSKSACSSIPDHGAKSTVSYKPSTAQETIQSAEFSMAVPKAPTPDPEDHIHNPDLLLTSNSDCDDLSILPRPKKVLPKRELPWVFRYKVKKGMNTLSRIMASKPAPNALHTNYTLT